jgi:GTPase SAR1 family protein
MIVYDVTRDKTFQAAPKWKNDIDENLANIPVLLLANKV